MLYTVPGRACFGSDGFEFEDDEGGFDVDVDVYRFKSWFSMDDIVDAEDSVSCF